VGSDHKPKLAVWKLASCDGCQLSVLNLEEELLALGARLELAYFPEATSYLAKGPYDISLAEGSIATPEDVERIHEARRSSRYLATLGACATAGGIQGLRNFADVGDFLARVYPAPSQIEALATSTPASDHVQVDFQLQGCPISERQLLELVTAFLEGRKPVVPSHSVCMECKMNQTVCVMVAHGTPCLGPVTHAGCGALCPGYHRGCYGCFGPKETPNTASLTSWFRRLDMEEGDIRRSYRTYYAGARPFLEESESLAE